LRRRCGICAMRLRKCGPWKVLLALRTGMKMESPKQGSLEVTRPKIWTDGKAKAEERRSERKGRKVAQQGVFPMFCGSGGSNSRRAKAAGTEPSKAMRDEKLHAPVARIKVLKSKCTRQLQCRSTFGS
jgi:hypothetical protein